MFDTERNSPAARAPADQHIVVAGTPVRVLQVSTAFAAEAEADRHRAHIEREFGLAAIVETLAVPRVGDAHDGSDAPVDEGYDPRGPHIVVTGNPVDGLFFHGPFASHEAAHVWAAREHPGGQWWTALLHAPRPAPARAPAAPAHA